MIYIHLGLEKYRRYYNYKNSIVTGQIFDADKLYKEQNFAEFVCTWDNRTKFITKLQEVNGFFACINSNGTELFAAVDRVRSIPLFYGQKGKDFYISDYAEWVRQEIGNTELDKLAKEEFLLTGYVTGSDTLYPDVKQIQAGEAIFVKDTGAEVYIETERYYRYIHNYPEKISEEELLEEHDRVLVNVFERLIKIANNRTIVVPLSGGYDSRLIVVMLKRLGYENIVAFSYGRPGNRESEISRQVAQSLGIRWEFVPYSNEAWYKWFHSDEREEYWQMASNLSSIPHNQDWPAVGELRKRGIISRNSILVAGHTGDFIAGGHIPLTINCKKIEERLIVKSVFEKHYSLWDCNDQSNLLSRLLETRIIKCSEFKEIDTPNKGANALEKWEWQERQAKFIINSLRVYDFWNYGWWMPLWDAEYMKFWCRVPLEYRLGKRLYDKYVQQLYVNIAGVNDKRTVIPKNSIIVPKVKTTLQKMGLYKKVKDMYQYINLKKKLRTEYDNHPLAVWGRFTRDEFEQMYRGKETQASLHTKMYIQQIEKKDILL